MPEGYSRTTKALHWSTVLAMAAQFAIGYAMDPGGRGRGRGRGRGGDEPDGDDSGPGSGSDGEGRAGAEPVGGEDRQGRGRGRGGDLEVFGDDALLTVHVLLGLAILALAVARVAWRRHAGLPPWAETLSKVERTLAHYTERTLLLSQFAIPLTGLWLVVVDDDAVAAHVVTHIVFLVALAAHVGLVVKHQVVDRDRLIRRIL